MSDGKHVFISYSRRDGHPYAERLETAMQQRGLSVWRDIRDIDPAKDFTADIERGIETASHVVVCVTPDSKRDDSFVRREIQYALLSKKPIIPLRFTDMNPHIPIINFEWIDLYKEWDKPFDRLCEILGSNAEAFRQRKSGGDPFQPYLETVYKRTVRFLSQTVIKLIDLSTEPTPNAVNSPQSHLNHRDMIDLFFTAQGIEDAKATTSSTFAEAFEHYEGRVLLLGEPGAGKTITLWSFARDAVARRLADPTAPLPLLGLISSWDAENRTGIADWLATGNQLDSEPIIRQISEGTALLLLDGLDELGSEREDSQTQEKYDPRQRFMMQIPANNQIIITSRVRDYQEIGQKIALKGAVTLNPLNESQMRVYLSEQSELWTAIQADAGLKQMLATPLLLSFFAFAYRDDLSGEERIKLTQLQHAGDVRDKIFEQYLRKRYEYEERRVKFRGEEMPFTLEETYEIFGKIALRNPLRDINENILFEFDFVELIGKDQVPHFIEFAIRLHILLNLITDRPLSLIQEYHFTHLLLRDYFVYWYCLPRLSDMSLYTVLLNNPAEGLGKIRDSRSFKPLLELLQNKIMSARVRGAAARALGSQGETQAYDSLVKTLESPEQSVRFNVVWALGRLGDKRATEILLSHLHDSNKAMRDGIVEALGRLKDTRAIEPLTHLLADNSEIWPTVRICDTAAEALERIGTPEALEAVRVWREQQSREG